MKLHFAIIPLLFTSALYGQTGAYDPARLYPADSLRADLRYLRHKLEVMHPGLYRYATRVELGGLFDSLGRSIDKPMNDQQFLSLLFLVQARIRNGHTMFLPGTDAMTWFKTRERFLPLDVRSFGGKLFIRQNYSADSIEEGTEIIRINGVGSAEVWRQLMIRQIRDGYNQTYPEWILDQYFYPHYSFVFGQSAEFQLELRNGSGDTVRTLIHAPTRDSIAWYRQLRYGRPDDGGQGITLRELTGKKIAVLTIRSLDPEMLLSRYMQDYRKAMDSAFHRLRQNGDSALILDLRDNQGGDFAAPCFLLARLIAKPTPFLVGGPESRLVRPVREGFSGRLVVLVNGGSFSATAILAATLERDKRAVFVGEETGGNKYIISGDPEEVILPCTKISCSIPTTTYKITTGVNNGRGLIPQYPVRPELGDLGTGRDRAMEMAERLVKRQ
jgi:hypothetical protein